MQKYIAVVNPRMDNDDISRLIAKDVAGALFSISHEDYPLAAKMISQIKELSRRQNRPISIIQDVSGMQDPLDLQFGLRSGADWVVTDQAEHVKMAKGLKKLAKVIFKGRDLPKGIRVDSVMADSFLDPDAQVLGQGKGQIKHIIMEHPDQKLIDSIIDIANFTNHSGILVVDLDIAKALSWRRHDKKIIFAPKKPADAARAGIYWGVQPIFRGPDLMSSLHRSGLTKKGERVVDASDIKHVVIRSV